MTMMPFRCPSPVLRWGSMMLMALSMALDEARIWGRKTSPSSNMSLIFSIPLDRPLLMASSGDTPSSMAIRAYSSAF